MPKKRLTEQGVAKLKLPKTGTVDYYDAGMPGLVLRLNYGGAKSWRALYYVPTVAKSGKRKGQRISIPTTHELGRFPILSLKQARDKARVFLADPQRALAQADVGSFKEIAEAFIKLHVENPDPKSKLRTREEVVRVLTKYVFPHWQHRQFRDIRRGDVAALLDKVQLNNGPRQADVVLAVVRKLMNWYQSRNDDYVTPIVKGMHRHNGGDHKRKRVLGSKLTSENAYNDAELRALWKACDDAGTFGALIKVLLLTGQRRNKVATMQWEDLNDAGVWTIPKEDREKTNAETLRLPQAVLDIINAQPRIAANPYVFAGRGSGPFNSFSQRKEELDKKLNIPPWVIHDLRRTAKTLMARAGVRPDISERVLGHTIRGVEGVYDQHGYDTEKADALNRLAALVDTISLHRQGPYAGRRRVHGRGADAPDDRQ
jgi:integrase